MENESNTPSTIKEAQTQSSLLKVLNPVATLEIETVRPAERLTDLNNKRIGLYWNRKARGDVALRKIEAVLKKKFAGLSFTWFEKDISIALVAEHLKSIEGSTNDAIISTSGD